MFAARRSTAKEPKPVTIPRFKGIYQKYDENINPITSGYATQAQNLDLKDGTINRCKGSVLYDDAIIPAGCKTLMCLYKDTTPHILAAQGGCIYELVDGVFVQKYSGFTSDDFNYVNFIENDNQLIIMTNGVDNVKIYDGTNWWDAKCTGMTSQPGADNLAPKGKFIDVTNARVWIFDNKYAYFSTVNDDAIDCEDFTAPTDETEVNMHGGQIYLPTFDGTEQIAAKILFNDIHIFKQQSVQRIFGTTPDTYQAVPVFNLVDGYIVDKTIQSGKNMAFWFSTSGLEIYDGHTPDDLTPLFKDEFSKINMDAVGNSVAAFYKNKYTLAVPEAPSTVPNMIIEYDTVDATLMVKRGFEVTSFLRIKDDLLYTNSTGKLYRYNVGNDIAGADIYSFFLTGQSDFGDINTLKTATIRSLHAVGDGTIKISIISEKKAKTKSIKLIPGKEIYKVNLTHSGYILQLKIENTEGCSFKVIMPEIEVEG